MNKRICHRLGLIHQTAHVIIINNKNEVLLEVKVKRECGKYNLIGGHVSNTDASSLDAIEREVFEEIGLSVAKKKLICFTKYFRISPFNYFKSEFENRKIKELSMLKLDDDECRDIPFLF